MNADGPVARGASAGTVSGGNSWSVWRQDEHGNRFEMARGLGCDAARAAAADFEARGHKQHYWAEPTRDPGAAPAQPPSGPASSRHAS